MVIIKPELFILTYNRLEYLKLCLESVWNQTLKVPINIWDNGSTDGTREYLTDLYKNDKLNGGKFFDNASNVGIAEARNKGLELIKNTCIIISDDDMYYVDKNYFKHMFNCWNHLVKKHTRIAVLSNYHPFDKGKYSEKIFKEAYLFGKYELHYITGSPPGNWMLDKEVILSMNGFRIPNGKKMGFAAYHLNKRISNSEFPFVRIDKIDGKVYKGVEHIDTVDHPMNKRDNYKEYIEFRIREKGKD